MRRNLFVAIMIILASCAAASAQESTSNQRTNDSARRTSVNETFDLNITERRITEQNFAASLNVEAGEETARGLSLRVGVAVGADEISLLLRNVSGHVRFRATLERVIERLNARRTPGAVP